MTVTSSRPTAAGSGAPRRTHRWIDDWRPEDEGFWAATGARVARRNLVWSIFAEHLGFSVWMIWSVSSALLAAVGFAFSAQQLFFLVAIPSLVGALLRLPYTFAVPAFGGRNWTVFSALALLVPTAGYAVAVTDTSTPYWVFCVIAAFAGLGGGNFASSMTNINFFYPAARKGTALGLNAAGGNLGVALIQLLLPVMVGGAGIFGLVGASSDGIHLQRAAYVYAALCLVAAGTAYFLMDNLSTATSSPREQLAALRSRHTWIMAFIYVGTFGSFMGYSSAMPLLIKLNFWRQPVPGVAGIGIDFAYYAFLGALVGSLTRPLGGWLADRLGGARVTLGAFVAMIVGTLGVLLTLTRLEPLPAAPTGAALAAIKADPSAFSFKPEVVAAVDANAAVFPWFLLAFLFVFAATGIGNGSAYKMIPALFRRDAEIATAPATVERHDALVAAGRQSSAALGIIGAVGALGGFLIPVSFNSPWVTTPLEATTAAFVAFTAFYVVCAIVTAVVYLRRPRAHAVVLADARI
ncbi:MFS transporter, NNP family, nitrate/nitrite transporter [Nocardioides terrae]|uniref:MFS transporter, NNP family, nitrate/nitrite transporter n=1 Tax=Nocardioides terrae TaxID=574651 RepID=A0A1I1H0E1_9ACTN|nr:MFS transporter [Nocardioides terrae]SFC17012.1 MFS transporter, NNP family, nitrate/nitrite transporter [Nocardioides terrae]